MSVTTVHKYLCYERVAFFSEGVAAPSDFLSIQSTMSCSYHIFFIRRRLNDAPFACVTVLESSLFQMAERSKLPGPVQAHNTNWHSDKKGRIAD